MNADHLTATERSLLVHLAQGKTVQEAADEMGLTLQSAKNRLQFAYAKLGVRNRFEAFVEMRWMKPPEQA